MHETVGEPPDPAGATTYDELSERLRALRSWAGMPYRDVHRRVLRSRRARGVAELPAYNTVYRCLQPGRSRLDAELVVDIAGALLGEHAPAGRWRQACRVIENRASDAVVVTVTDGLPDDLAGFTGRSAEIAGLREVVHGDTGNTGVISVIEGMAGVGKTRTAVRLAHQLVAAGLFPDVCLAVNLRGYDADLPPADPAAVLEGFLRVLGVSGSQVASMDLTRRAATFRAQLVGKRALVLLDNAASVDQVRPLLPEHPSCVALVTSRHRLDGLDAARLSLEAFSQEESLELLRREAGADRVAAEPDSAAAIAETAGHLPLALSLLAARIKSSPEWTLADHVERLTERREKLRLEDGVRAAISLSYDGLGAEQRRLLRLLAVHPGRDIDAYAAAALTAAGLDVTRALLADLTTASLLHQRLTGRFELHDLVRVFATDREHDEEPARARQAARTRLFDHYRHVALTAMNRYAPQDADRRPDLPDPSTPGPDIPDRESATAWLDTERPNLIAVAVAAEADGHPEYAGDLSQILFRYLYQAIHLSEAETLHTLAIRTSEGQVKGRALSSLGVTYSTLGRCQQARDLLASAVAVYRECGDELGEHIALGSLGAVEFFLSQFAEARRLFQSVADFARAHRDGMRLGGALRNVGLTQSMLGHFPEALKAHQESLDIARDAGDRFAETASLVHIGSVQEDLGWHQEALGSLQQGVRLARELGYRLAESDALYQLGVVHTATGECRQALEHHEQALAIAMADGVRVIEIQIRNGMGAALRGLDDLDRATRQHRAALDMAVELEDRYSQACAHDGLGTSLAAAGDVESAHGHWREALALYTDLGTPEAADIAAKLPDTG